MFLHLSSQLLNWICVDYCRAHLPRTVLGSTNLFACFTFEQLFPRELSAACVRLKEREPGGPHWAKLGSCWMCGVGCTRLVRTSMRFCFQLLVTSLNSNNWKFSKWWIWKNFPVFWSEQGPSVDLSQEKAQVEWLLHLLSQPLKLKPCFVVAKWIWSLRRERKLSVPTKCDTFPKGPYSRKRIFLSEMHSSTLWMKSFFGKGGQYGH